jgi:G3E family GTPase
MTDAGQTLPVTVLTGFLGSGKTTLLGKLLLQPEMAGTAVIINEFGEVGLDDLLVQQQEKPVLLKNGCLCCTVRGDLAITLQDLLLRRVQQGYAFQRVMIETTGLADPAPIIHTLMTDPGIAGRYRLEGIVTVIDCVNGLGTFGRHPEATKQAAVADRLLLTKQDIARSDDIARLRQQLRVLNAGAILIDAPHGEVAAADVLGLGLYDPRTKRIDVEKWLRAEAYAEAHDHAACAIDGCRHESHHHNGPSGQHGDTIRSCCLIRERPIAWNDFSTWMGKLTETKSAELLRVKGIINIIECPGEPLVIHGVQDIFHPPVRMSAWPSGDERTRIVLIARDWDESEIAAEFAELP